MKKVFFERNVFGKIFSKKFGAGENLERADEKIFSKNLKMEKKAGKTLE